MSSRPGVNGRAVATLGSLVLVAGITTMLAQAPTTRVDCTSPLPEPITLVPVAGRPLHPTPTQDGCWIFTAFLGRSGAVPPSGLAVLRRTGDRFEETKAIPLAITGSGMGGMALTPDEKVLVTSYGQGLVFFDVARLTGGQSGDPLLGSITGLRLVGSFGVTTTRDGRYVLSAQNNTAWVAIVDLQKALASGFDDKALQGGIPTAPGPITPVLSNDGRHLYVSSAIAPEVVEGPRTCSSGKQAEGAIQIVDFKRALLEPSAATVAFAGPAGCGLNAMTLSPDGARLSNTFVGDIFSPTGPLGEVGLAVFDTRSVSSGEPAVPLGRVPLPRGPIAVLDDGNRLYVGFRDNPNLPQPNASNIVVIDASKVSAGRAAVVGTLPVAAGHLAFSADRRTLYGAMWDGQVAVIDLARAPLEPVQEQTGQGVTR